MMGVSRQSSRFIPWARHSLAVLSMQFWTIGHSTRSLGELISALTGHGITLLADVRKLPGSRRYPHFNQDELEKSLPPAGINYAWYADLGGRRKGATESHNTAWRNASFRAYADYMETEEFESAIQKLLDEAKGHRIATMCSEAVWWRCHRGLISDYLKAAGHEVLHIQDAKRAEPHPYTSAAKIVGGKLSYRGEPELF
jgi:uncharacterized protein (DUF488 family)